MEGGSSRREGVAHERKGGAPNGKEESSGGEGGRPNGNVGRSPAAKMGLSRGGSMAERQRGDAKREGGIANREGENEKRGRSFGVGR